MDGKPGLLRQVVDPVQAGEELERLVGKEDDIGIHRDDLVVW